MINFIKGIFVGIFNIIPGLSGSALLVVFDLYEKCLETIGFFFKNPKKNVLFLFPIASGIILGTYLFSNVVFILLKSYPTFLYIVFTFFILGTIPHLFKEATKNGFEFKYLISFTFAFILGASLLFFDTNNTVYTLSYSFFNFIKMFLIGVILSFSTVIPGISSTVLLSLTNLYGIYIKSVSTLNMFVLIPAVISYCATTFLISKLINCMLKKYYGYTYFGILGFSLSTIPTLLKSVTFFNQNILFSIVTGVVFFFITWRSFKVS